MGGAGGLSAGIGARKGARGSKALSHLVLVARRRLPGREITKATPLHHGSLLPAPAPTPHPQGPKGMARETRDRPIVRGNLPRGAPGRRTKGGGHHAVITRRARWREASPGAGSRRQAKELQLTGERGLRILGASSGAAGCFLVGHKGVWPHGATAFDANARPPRLTLLRGGQGEAPRSLAGPLSEPRRRHNTQQRARPKLKLNLGKRPTEYLGGHLRDSGPIETDGSIEAASSILFSCARRPLCPSLDRFVCGGLGQLGERCMGQEATNREE